MHFDETRAPALRAGLLPALRHGHDAARRDPLHGTVGGVLAALTDLYNRLGGRQGVYARLDALEDWRQRQERPPTGAVPPPSIDGVARAAGLGGGMGEPA